MTSVARASTARRRLAFLLIFALATASAALRWMPSAAGTGKAAPEMDKWFRVKRADFAVTLPLDGKLEAMKNYPVTFDPTNESGEAGDSAEDEPSTQDLADVLSDDSIQTPDIPFGQFGFTHVTWTAANGTFVKKGDVVLKFDDEPMREPIEQIRLALDDEELKLTLAREDLNAQKAAGLLKVQEAASALRNAVADLQQYNEVEAPRRRKVLMAQAETKTSSNSAPARTSPASSASPAIPAETGLSESTTSSQPSPTGATSSASGGSEAGDLRQFSRFEYPQRMQALQGNVERARVTLAQAALDAKSNVAKAERTIWSGEKRLAAYRKIATKANRMRERFTIRAKADGLYQFVKCDFNTAVGARVGAPSWSGMAIAQIADCSSLVMEGQVSEQDRSQVKTGLPVRIWITSLSELTLAGTITEIDTMPTKLNRGYRNSQKFYKVNISVETKDARLIPGMRARAEIVAEEFHDILAVPIEAVFRRNGKAYCRVRNAAGPTEREVETGRDFVHNVEIKQGLCVGEDILLFNPSTSSEKAP